MLPRTALVKRAGASASELADQSVSATSQSALQMRDCRELLSGRGDLWGIRSQWIEGPSTYRLKRLLPPITPSTGLFSWSTQGAILTAEASASPTMLCYGSFSHAGSLKQLNEDRVAVHCSHSSEAGSQLGFNLLAIFDGHGGDGACNYSKEHLHTQLLEYIRARPGADPLALLAEFIKVFDSRLIEHLTLGEKDDRSGTCAVFVCTFGSRLFLVNVGDSRAICRKSGSREVQQLTKDHRPDDQDEADRIIKNQGYIYRNSGAAGRLFARQLMPLFMPRRFKQPLRVFPSHLSVSRTLGDYDVKRYFPRVIVSDPDVAELTEQFDYLLLGSDGVFEVLTNAQIDTIVSDALQHRFASLEAAVETILSLVFQELVSRHCSDNISLVFIAGTGFLNLASISGPV